MPKPLRQEEMEWQFGDLGRGIPDRHVKSTDSNTPLAMAARLLARHHDLAGSKRIEVRAAAVGQGTIRRIQQSRREPLTDEAP